MRQLIHVPVPMRDGVNLSADVRYPDSGGPFPTVLVRTPYGNAGFDATDAACVARGYAVVKQDCRGRFDSEGAFDPMFEDSDGFDTIRWLNDQHWCNGSIGMRGGSYSAQTQYTAAWTRPPGLKAIAPACMTADLFKNSLYQNGVLNLSLAIAWGAGVAGRTGQSNITTDWEKVFRHLPLLTMDKAAGHDLPYFREWLSHATYDDFWARGSAEQHWPRINVPALHVGGWYDVYSYSVFRNFNGLRACGGACQKALVGPWTHGGPRRLVGQLDFGPEALVDTENLVIRWLDRWVRGEENGIGKEPPIRIFVMGRNAWRDEDEWPPARSRATELYLASGGKANSLYGDGTLSLTVPEERTEDRYTYNPENPVPTLGGACLLTEMGPTDHRPIERRDDVLVYTGEPLAEPLEVTGDVQAVLFVSSDAVDTDFVARLCDVYPDGRSIILCDGIMRTRFREGLDREVLMTPGSVYELRIEMGPTANVFLPGHRLRLEVTSSCFPRFARNLNTGEPAATGTRMQLARQTVHHAPECPSRLLLPVIE